MSDVDYDPEAHYDRVTRAWNLLLGDELHYGVFDRGDEPLDEATANLTRRMIDAARLEPGLTVLDVGCGSGAPACLLARNHGVEVLGITTSAVGVDEARARAGSEAVSGVRFDKRDGTDNGLDAASFDRVWVLESSHLMRERERLVAECTRVLRAGGRMMLCDIIRRREIPFDEVRDRRDDFLTLREAFGDAHMESLDVYASLFDDHGLDVDVSDDLTDATLPTFDRWRANLDAHRDEVTEALGPALTESFARSCDILEGFWRDGTLGYGLIAAQKRG